MRWFRGRREAELDEELRTHLELATRERIARGEDPAEAALAVRREFGNLGDIKETTRAVWGWGWLAWLAQDLRYAGRALRRSPGFSAVAILSLGLGIGANSVAFSVIDGFLLRRLPVPSPEQLVYLREHGWSSRATDDLNYPTYLRLRREATVLAGVAAEAMIDRSGIGLDGPGGGSDAGRARVAVVTGSYFATMGVGAGLGRTLDTADDQILLGHPVAVISDAYWARRLGRAPDVLHRNLSLNGTRFQIVGVAPPEFPGDWVGRPVDVWIPFSMHQRVFVELPGPMTGANTHALHVIGRLAPGATLTRAAAQIQLVYQREMLEEAGPSPTPEVRSQIARWRLEPVSAEHGYSQQREALAQPIRILTLVVALLLVIACANVAGLLLARGAARERELAVRLAVGAGRGRLARQLLTESLLLALLGGGLGVAIAFWGTRFLAAILAAGPVQVFFARSSWLAFDLPVNLRTLGWTAALCVLTGICFGLAPAWRASNIAPATGLLGRGPEGARRPGPTRVRPGRALVVLQVALSLVVLIAAALLVETLRNLRSLDLGYDREHVLLVWTQPSSTPRGNDPAGLRVLWHDVQQRIEAVPGVTRAGASNQGVLSGSVPVTTQAQTPIRIDGESPKPVTASMFRTFVTPGYFAALGIPLLAGRDFTERDTDSLPAVMIVSQSMAQFYFGRSDPVGRRVHLGQSDSLGTTIIGVVGDLISGTPRGAGVPQFLWYLPYRDKESARRLQTMIVVVRSRADPLGVAPAIRRAVAAADPELPVLRINTVNEQLDDVLAQDRLVAGLAAWFGALTALLACLGLYGLMAYTTARRSSELGIRMALGATARGLLGLVLRESSLLVLTGIALGVPLALVGARLLQSHLFRISAADPVALVGAAVLMLAVALLAALSPALHAARTDPIAVLRSE